MTVSRHEYTAHLIGTPDRVLSVLGGTYSLDVGTSPHVTGSLEIAVPGAWEWQETPYGVSAGDGGGYVMPVWVPDMALLDDLDPRSGTAPRVRLTATRDLQVREFDLGVRSREIDHESGTVRLTLASDEAILSDYAPLADDFTPLADRDSLHALVNGVLDTVLPGASLDATSAADRPVPVVVDSENLIRNPRAVGAWDWQQAVSSGTLNTGSYSTGGPSYAPSYWYMQASGSVTGAHHYITESVVSIRGNEDYVLSVATRHPSGVNVTVDAVIFDGSGNVIAYATPVASTGSGAWKRSVVRFRTPATAARVRPRVLVTGTLASGNAIDITGWRLSQDNGDPTDTGYFDGYTTDTATYEYSFGSDPFASPSRRTAVIDAAAPEALTWRAGQSAMDLLHPILQSFGLRLVCDEARVWTIRDADFTAPGMLNVRSGVNLIEGQESISRDESYWYDAAVCVWTWTDREGVQRRQVESYAAATPHTRLRTFEKTTPYPGPGFAEYAVNRARGRGREITVTTVADWTTHAEQMTALRLDGSPLQTGKAQSVVFDLTTDRMTVTDRTTDTPEMAWILIDPDETWTDSPAGGSWTEE